MGKKRSAGLKKRSPIVSDIFYPDNRETLVNRLVSWELKKDSGGHLFEGQAIIVPHGAWDISGEIAGAAFAPASYNSASARAIKKVILLGPCHSCVEEGIYLSESVSFKTPLGELPVDLKLGHELASCSSLIRENDIPHLSEHSLEVILPLVKYCLGNVSIVPILMSSSSAALIDCLAKALRTSLENHTEESLFVISTNVSQNQNPAIAFSMAEEFRTLMESMDTRTFSASLAAGRISACGAAPLTALLESGLLDGKQFRSLGPLAHSREENGQTIYYGAFATG